MHPVQLPPSPDGEAFDEILRRANAGDREARDMMIVTLTRIASRSVSRIMRGDPDLYADAVQDAALALTGNLWRDEQARFKGQVIRYAEMAAKSRALKLRGKEQLARQRFQSGFGPADADMRDFLSEAPAAATPEGRHERIKELADAVDSLAPEESEVVRLRFGLGGEPAMSPAAVSRRLKMDFDLVRRTEYDAMVRLADVLGADPGQLPAPVPTGSAAHKARKLARAARKLARAAEPVSEPAVGDSKKIPWEERRAAARLGMEQHVLAALVKSETPLSVYEIWVSIYPAVKSDTVVRDIVKELAEAGRAVKSPDPRSSVRGASVYAAARGDETP